MMRAEEEFIRTLNSDQPPTNLSAALVGLWWDAKGDWDKAHACVDACTDEAGIRVHAYLHRKEGDLSNAAYWYGRVDRAVPDISLADERETLRRDLLAPRR
ncbi:MAG: hypothetical protein JWM91_1134 [Rhodospirillales bacterium]|nr:hypothetical protein [Rhodospirillales bacterium]